jgi:hypothetical protein
MGRCGPTRKPESAQTHSLPHPRALQKKVGVLLGYAKWVGNSGRDECASIQPRIPQGVFEQAGLETRKQTDMKAWEITHQINH